MPALLHLCSAEHLQLRLDCDIGQVRSAAERACRFFKAKGLSENELTACELALVEGCNNAVLYAKPSGQLDAIEIDLRCDKSRIEMRVHDHTDGFDLPETAQLASPESEHGRGIFIMQSLMDSVDYEVGIGKNILTLQKQRQDSGSATIDPPVNVDELKARLAESEQVISEMAEELSSCYESLSAIFRSGTELGKSDNLQQFVRTLCEDLLKITGADWFLLRIVPERETSLRIFESSVPISNQELEAAPSVEMQAARLRKDVRFGPRMPLASEDPLRALPESASGLVHPFYFSESLLGTLAIGHFAGESPFTAAHVNVAHTFADFLGIQIVNARMRAEQINHRLVTHELEIARGIQRALLPKQMPRLPRFNLAGFCESARHVGGDFFDAVQINNDSALLVIADVMGKGVPAAMFAAILRSVVRGAPDLARQPSALMTRVNQTLFDELSEVDMFITVQLAFVDATSRSVVLANAGHCPALLVSNNSADPELISADGMPLGILRETKFAEEHFSLPPGSRLLLYTDGLTEARNTAGIMFGHDRLENWARQSRTISSVAELKDSLAAMLTDFQGHTPPRDDQTFLILAEETN